MNEFHSWRRGRRIQNKRKQVIMFGDVLSLVQYTFLVEARSNLSCWLIVHIFQGGVLSWGAPSTLFYEGKYWLWQSRCEMVLFSERKSCFTTTPHRTNWDNKKVPSHTALFSKPPVIMCLCVCQQISPIVCFGTHNFRRFIYCVLIITNNYLYQGLWHFHISNLEK